MIKEMPTDGEAWEIENVSGFTMATTAAVKNRLDVVKRICCMTVDETMTEEQMRPGDRADAAARARPGGGGTTSPTAATLTERAATTRTT